MATKTDDGRHIIAAGEVGVFCVCPQSWKLRSVDRESIIGIGDAVGRGQALHQSWSALVDEYLVLIKWVRYLAVLLCAALAVFLILQPTTAPLRGLLELSFRNRALQLLFVVGASFLVIKTFGRAATRKHSDSGLPASEKTISIDGSASLPAREYISRAQGLAGKPDALINEGGLVLPIEIKPLARKLRDRYVAQLLVYMRLVEEFEGQRPPHGYLILGPNNRRVKIENSEERQLWLDGLIKQMRSVLNGGAAKAEPHPVKCAKCDVRHRCVYSAK